MPSPESSILDYIKNIIWITVLNGSLFQQSGLSSNLEAVSRAFYCHLAIKISQIGSAYPAWFEGNSTGLSWTKAWTARDCDFSCPFIWNGSSFQSHLFHKGTAQLIRSVNPLPALLTLINIVVWTSSKCHLLCYMCSLQPTSWEAAALAEQPIAFTFLQKVPHCHQRQPAWEATLKDSPHSSAGCRAIPKE